MRVAISNLAQPAPRRNQTSIWRNDTFLRLWLGLSVSLLGDSFLLVALQNGLYTQTRSTAVVSNVLTALMVGGVVASALGGALVDRFNRRTLMLVADGARLVLVLFVLGLLQWLAGGSALATTWAMGLIYPCLALMNAFAAIFAPALHMSLPTVVEPDLLPKANGLIATSQRLGLIAGYTLAGAFLMVGTISGALLIDALTFLFSMVCVLWARPFGAPRRATRSPLGKDLREGLRYVLQSLHLRSVMLGALAINIAAGIFLALLTPVVSEQLGMDGWILGLAMAANAAGVVIASLWVSPWVAKQEGRRGRYALAFMAVQGCCQALFANSHWVWLSIGLMVVVGLSIGVYNMMILRFLQTQGAEEVRGRVYGLYITTVQVSAPVAMALASPLAHWAGSAPLVFTVSGVAVCALALMLQRLPGLRDI
jgi:MFS family permease